MPANSICKKLLPGELTLPLGGSVEVVEEDLGRRAGGIADDNGPLASPPEPTVKAL